MWWDSFELCFQGSGPQLTTVCSVVWAVDKALRKKIAAYHQVGGGAYICWPSHQEKGSDSEQVRGKSAFTLDQNHVRGQLCPLPPFQLQRKDVPGMLRLPHGAALLRLNVHTSPQGSCLMADSVSDDWNSAFLTKLPGSSAVASPRSNLARNASQDAPGFQVQVQAFYYGPYGPLDVTPISSLHLHFHFCMVPWWSQGPYPENLKNSNKFI